MRDMKTIILGTCILVMLCVGCHPEKVEDSITGVTIEIVDNETGSKKEIFVEPPEKTETTEPAESAEEVQLRYKQILQDVQNQKARLRDKYKNAEDKQHVINEAWDYIFSVLVDEIFPCWYGTKWHMGRMSMQDPAPPGSGVTQIPRKGTIACGYFVSTTLRDAGFDVERVALAKEASGKIIETLVNEVDDNKNKISKLIKKTMPEFEQEVKNRGKGLFIVGLDCHVGFIINDGKDVYFCHSDYTNPERGVVSEKAIDSFALKKSVNKTLGKILDDKMIIYWLLNKHISTVRGNYNNH